MKNPSEIDQNLSNSFELLTLLTNIYDDDKRK